MINKYRGIRKDLVIAELHKSEREVAQLKGKLDTACNRVDVQCTAKLSMAVDLENTRKKLRSAESARNANHNDFVNMRTKCDNVITARNLLENELNKVNRDVLRTVTANIEHVGRIKTQEELLVLYSDGEGELRATIEHNQNELKEREDRIKDLEYTNRETLRIINEKATIIKTLETVIDISYKRR